jgi:hypothetical protein
MPIGRPTTLGASRPLPTCARRFLLVQETSAILLAPTCCGEERTGLMPERGTPDATCESYSDLNACHASVPPCPRPLCPEAAASHPRLTPPFGEGFPSIHPLFLSSLRAAWSLSGGSRSIARALRKSLEHCDLQNPGTRANFPRDHPVATQVKTQYMAKDCLPFLRGWLVREPWPLGRAMLQNTRSNTFSPSTSTWGEQPGSRRPSASKRVSSVLRRARRIYRAA